MKIADFVHYRKITKDLDSGKPCVRRAGWSRTHDVIVAALLLALLVVAIVTTPTISDEVADSNADRRNYVAFVIDLVVTVGLSIGVGWLLLAARPRATMNRARFTRMRPDGSPRTARDDY